MSGGGGTGMPSLSQILAWDAQHLCQAAVDWVSTAEQWEGSFSSVHHGCLSPGGTVWEGVAADAARERTFADLVRVRGLSDTLREAATIARRGADQLDYLKRNAIDAIKDAREAGFAVGEDLSVTDPSGRGALRVGQARQHAATIAARATALSVADNEIATKITTTTTELTHHGFDQSERTTIQAVDYKTAPPTPAPGTPDDSGNDSRHPDYPDHKPDGTWAPGNSGVDGDVAANHTFDEMEALGTPLIRQQIQVKVTDPATGKTYARVYDALQPTEVPGQYIGIEHKVNASPITTNQRTVDDLVNAGTPARGILNGQPIEVVDVDVIRTSWPPSAQGIGEMPGSAPMPVGGNPAPLPATVGGGGGSWGDTSSGQAGGTAIPDWGTHLSPGEAAKGGGEIGNLGKILESYLPHDPNDPNNTA